MTTVSSHALHPPTPKSLKVSRSWSLRSLQLSHQALAEAEGGSFMDTPLEAAEAVCQRARAVGLHNMGMLAEVSDIGLSRKSREILTKCRWKRTMQEPRISSRRPLQPRGRQVSLKASERLWLLCVEYKTLQAKVHSREKKKEEKEDVAWIQDQKLYSFYKKTISQMNI